MDARLPSAGTRSILREVEIWSTCGHSVYTSPTYIKKCEYFPWERGPCLDLSVFSNYWLSGPDFLQWHPPLFPVGSFSPPLTLCATSHFVCLFIIYRLHLTQQHRQLEYKLHESRNSVVFTVPFSVPRWFQECSRTHLLNEWPICTLEHCLFYVSVPQMCVSELCIQW